MVRPFVVRRDFEDLGAVVSTRAEALCALVPVLRMAAVGLTRRADEADDLVHDALLQGVLLGERGDATDLSDELLTRMRNGFYTRTRLNGWDGTGHDEPEGVGLARRILDLPVEERGPLILVRLLGARRELACDLCGCGGATLATRLERAEMRLLGGPCLVSCADERLHFHA